jgi:hypothetical protein
MALLEITIRLDWGKKDSGMSKWSAEAGRKFKRHQEAKHIQNSITVSKERAFDTHAPRLFEELTALFDEECAAFNSDSGIRFALVLHRDDKSESFHVNRKGNSTSLIGNLIGPLHIITLKGKNGFKYEAEIRIEINDALKPSFTDGEGNQITADSIVTSALNALLEI